MPESIVNLRKENNDVKSKISALSEEISRLKDLIQQQNSSAAPSTQEVSHRLEFLSKELGAPNDQFVVKCIIIPQLMKINVIKAFSGVFQCCWENIIFSLFPARHTRNFPAS